MFWLRGVVYWEHLGHGAFMMLIRTVTPNAAYPKLAAVIVVSISIITSIMLRLTYLRAYELTHSCAYFAPAYPAVYLVLRRRLGMHDVHA